MVILHDRCSISFLFQNLEEKADSTGGEGRGQARGRGNTWCWAPWLQAWWPLVREKPMVPGLVAGARHHFFLVTVTKKKFDRRLKKSCTFSKKIEHFSKFCQNGIWARGHRHFEMVSKSSPFLYDLKGGDAAEKRGGTRRKKTGDKNFDANHTSRAGPGPQKQLMYEKKQ